MKPLFEMKWLSEIVNFKSVTFGNGYFDRKNTTLNVTLFSEVPATATSKLLI